MENELQGSLMMTQSAEQSLFDVYEWYKELISYPSSPLKNSIEKYLNEIQRIKEEIKNILCRDRLRNEHESFQGEHGEDEVFWSYPRDCYKLYICTDIPNRTLLPSLNVINPYVEEHKQLLVNLSVISKSKELSSQNCNDQEAVLRLTHCEIPSPDHEQNVFFSVVERKLGFSVHCHYSYCLEHTRDDACQLLNDLTEVLLKTANNSRSCLLDKGNDVYEINVSKTGTIIKARPLFCLDTIDDVDEGFERETLALQNDRRLREQQLKSHVQNFFMNESDILIHKGRQIKVKEMIADNVETINKNGSNDVTINDARDQSGLTYVIGDIGNENRLKEKQIRNHLENFFEDKDEMKVSVEEKVNGENQTEEIKQMEEENVKSIDNSKCDEAVEDGKDRSENQGLIDVIPEIFRFVEVRSGTDIVACPAAQQQVLDPFLNQFSSPNNKPSKHDTMAMEFLRLCSMHDYPSKQGPSLLRLAEAGFYYEGNGEELICFSCGVRNRVWSYNESPKVIHQRLSPGCKFLTSDGDGNVPVPRNLPTEELASNHSGMVETDGLSNSDSASAREPANNTAHLSSASYSPLRSESPPRVMVVKHPEYSARAARLSSYQTFPRHMKQHPADMTDAGFYYAGFGDCCRCFHCGIGLRNWDPEDNPWIEHARWSAECPYILQMKGQAFVDLVQEAARAAEMADSDGDNGADSTSASTQEKSAMNEKSGADNSASKAPANSSYEVENNVAKTSEAEISKGTLEDGGSSAGHNVEAKPIKAPLRTAAAQSLIHDENIKPKYVTAAIEELVKTEGWGAFSLENIRKYLKIEEDGSKSASSASNADPSVLKQEVLKQENKELKDLTICKICLDEKVSIVFLPCGHLVSCPQCAPALTKCPICRKGIKGTVRTNLVEKNNIKSNSLDKNNPKTNSKKT